jgi:tetratricopeptide (TPR) repeat protein/tRNA A-37 threonylcarbamoyl transferase component Bud32
MSASLPTISSLPLAAAQWVDRACRGFETVWKAGQRPSLKKMVPASAPEPVRSVLFLELLALELAYRRARGERPLPEEYTTAFPDCAHLVNAAFAPTQSAPQSRPSIGRTVAGAATVPPTPNSVQGNVGEGATVPGYEVLGELGRGGMGVVYKARQTALKRYVALKVLTAGSHAGAQQRVRFRQEAEAVARLQHPHIVQIFEVGEKDGQPYFAMEYVPGCTLSQKLSGTPVAARQAAELVATLAQAMEYAHRRGIVHRDLKPANVLLTPEGQPKVTDFGLAKQLDDEQGQTQSGAVMGTPSYMAPEQAAGKSKDIGPAADVYALGAILYEMLTGRPPFKAETPLETMRQAVTEEPVAPSRLQSKVPRDLETICLKCLHKEPARRYASALDLAEDLRRFRAGEPIQARPVGRLEKALKWAKRRPAVAALWAGGLLALLLTGAGWVWVEQQSAAQRAEAARRAAEKQAEAARRDSTLRQWMETALGRAADLEKQQRFLEALAVLEQVTLEVKKAIALDPKLAMALGVALYTKGRMDEAITCFRKATDLDPKNVQAHLSLGSALGRKGRVDEAIACYYKAIALDPKQALALGETLYAEGRVDEAIACFRKATDLDPKNVQAHLSLGNAQSKKGRTEEAIACYKVAVALDRKNVQACFNLGLVLYMKGRSDRAIECYRRAIALDPKFSSAHNNLGVILQDKGRVDQAIACYEKAIDLDARNAVAHANLGNVLKAKGRVDESKRCYQRAVACCRKGVALDPNTFQVQGALSEAMLRQGRFAEAGANARRCLELLPQGHPSRPFISRLLAQCERLLTLDAKLPALLQGQTEPASATESIEYADLCQYKKYHAACLRFYADAFAADPTLAENLATGNRYNAACAAAGQGYDADTLKEWHRASLRQQAIGWLRADLTLWTRQLERGTPQARALVRQKLRHWQRDADLAGLRGDAAVAKLPEEEQKTCRQLWADVAALLKRATKSK